MHAGSEKMVTDDDIDMALDEARSYVHVRTFLLVERSILINTYLGQVPNVCEY